MVAQRASAAGGPVASADVFSVPAQQLVRALQRRHVGRKLGLRESLNLPIHGVIARPQFAISQPVQHAPGGVGVEGENRPVPAEKLDPFRTPGRPIPGYAFHAALREAEFGAPSESFDPHQKDAYRPRSLRAARMTPTKSPRGQDPPRAADPPCTDRASRHRRDRRHFRAALTPNHRSPAADPAGLRPFQAG